jgi:amidohydrolase
MHPSPASLRSLHLLVLLALLPAPAHAADHRAAVLSQVDAHHAHLFTLYQHLHRHPELSFFEEKTAVRVAQELRAAGFAVTEKFGGHGVVAVLKNGDGPTILVRADLDALPVKEQTGLDYASKTMVKDADGNEVPTMHACGHDVHMTCLVGTARVLAALKERWQGTLVMIGQPAEERGGGAQPMIDAGLFTRFPRPEKCLALHVSADLPAGSIGYTEGFALANVDSMDIVIRGVGGHGAYPHTVKDPVVLAAQTILALQTVVSREIAPIEPAVVTVGSIHGGTKHNIVPDEVHLQLTLRSYTDEVREAIIAKIRRITRGLAEAAGMPEEKMPTVTVKDEFTPATYNDPELTRRVVKVAGAWLGEGNVIPRKPQMGGEDFGRYGRTEHKIPICMFWLGAVNPESVKASLKTGQALPSLHSPFFAPVPEPTIKTGVTTMTAVVLDLMGK